MREKCRKLLPEAEHGVMLLKVRPPGESYLHASRSTGSIHERHCDIVACSIHSYMQGGGPFNLYSTDMEGIFRQTAFKRLSNGSG